MPSKTALIIVDVQYDFLPPLGSMAVTAGETILSGIHDLLDRSKWADVWDVVVATQDWHPKGHVSFASRHSDAKPYSTVKWNDRQIGKNVEMHVWPDHCVQGSRGAELEDGLAERLKSWEAAGRYACFQKAYEPDIEAFSAFQGKLARSASAAEKANSSNNPLKKSRGTHAYSELGEYLQDLGVDRVVVVGLATDYYLSLSVCQTALSALTHPSATSSAFKVILPLSLIKGVADSTSEEAIERMRRAGAVVVREDEDMRKALGL